MYDQVKQFYDEHFTIANLNTSFEDKVGVISLICHLVQQVRMKNPDSTCYSVIMKLMSDKIIDEQFKKFLTGLSIMCEAFLVHDKEFPTFGLKTNKEIITHVKETLDTWIPF